MWFNERPKDWMMRKFKFGVPFPAEKSADPTLSKKR